MVNGSLEPTIFVLVINHIMIYVKTPVSEKETRRTRKIQTKTKPKTAEWKKKITASVQAVLQDGGENPEALHTSREK